MLFNAIGAYIICICLFKFYLERKSLAQKVSRLDPLPVWARVILTLIGLYFLLLEYSNSALEFRFYNFPFFLFSGFNLWVHEAGHIFFLPFGALFCSLGGALNEVIFPCLLFVWSRKNSLEAAAVFAIYWLGFNLVSISTYVSDARARALPLIGGGIEGHDWHNILSILGMLEYDLIISKITCLSGLLITGFSFFSLWKNYRNPRAKSVYVTH